MGKHFRRWNIWRKYCLNPWYHKLLVLLKIVHSPSMDFVILPEEQEEFMYKVADTVNQLSSTVDSLDQLIQSLGEYLYENKTR